MDDFIQYMLDKGLISTVKIPVLLVASVPITSNKLDWLIFVHDSRN